MRPPIPHMLTHKPTHKATCDSTRTPLSARRGRPTSRPRIWHASRTTRSVSNIIGSVPNGRKRWGGGRHRFIPRDHPLPTGPDAHRPRGQKMCDAPPMARARPFSHSQTKWKFTCSRFWPSTRLARTMGSVYIARGRRRNRRRRRRSRPARTFPSAGTRCTK